jgi:flavin-dependent dehydrogenase
MDAYDVCVFGTGPAGASTAARLADLGIAPVVLDRPSKAKPWGGESFSGAIRGPLGALGLWQRFCAAGHLRSYEQRLAWGGPPWTRGSIFNLHGNLWHVHRARFDDDLRQAVLARGIPFFDYHHLAGLRWAGSRWLLDLDAGTQISANYLVDATGRSRAIARRLGAKSRVYDRLIALTAVVARNPNPEFAHTMVLEATPHGWWYAAPVPQGHVLAFFTDPDVAPAEFARSLRTVAANSALTEPGRGPGWLAVGDAYAAHDPLCGWGVCRAMSNGILAAEAISCYLKHRDGSLLEQYQEHCCNQFQQYLTGLVERYSFERRWSNFRFWERRTRPLAPLT